MLKSIIIEGVDRLGKNSLIDGIKNQLGFFQVIHYQKPELLDVYLDSARRNLNRPDHSNDPSVLSAALNMYQRSSFFEMFEMLSTKTKYIMNRGHLGEVVYSPRYRKYSGDYVLDFMEKSFREDPNDSTSCINTTLLILLHTSSFDMIKDDGNSFDFDKKDEEQNDFVRAFEKSIIRHKIMIDINDGSGNFVPKDKILGVVIQAYKELESFEHQIMHVTWNKNEHDVLERNIYFQPDISKIIKE